MITRADLNQCQRPIDRVAARVAYAKNWHDSKKRVVQVSSATPIAWAFTPSTIKERRGDRHGDLVVVGFYEKFPKRSHRWVCRCVCGNYTIRTGIALNTQTDDDMCCRCKHERFLRRRARYLTGIPDPDGAQ